VQPRQQPPRREGRRAAHRDRAIRPVMRQALRADGDQGQENWGQTRINGAPPGTSASARLIRV
jgi:hypothetical protein